MTGKVASAIRLLGAAVLAVTLLVAPARAADPVKVGFSMALTGSVAQNGKQILLALEIWRDDLNAKGGLLGPRGRATRMRKVLRYRPRVMSLLAILALGFFLGMRHATDSDHIVAMTTIVRLSAVIATGLRSGLRSGPRS